MGCGVANQMTSHSLAAQTLLTLNKIYVRKELIGEGTFGKVYRCVNQLNGLDYALKVVEITAKTKLEAINQINNLKSQISVLKKLNHLNIIKYYSFDISPDSKNVEIVLQYAKNGSLKDLLKLKGTFSEAEASKKSKQILEGLKYLHGQSIVHRDLKCANILVSEDGTLKISDFGTAKHIKIQSNQDIAKMCASLKGTPYYMAPEILKRTGHNSSADIWSFGCTLIQMLSGKAPWTGLTSNFEQIISYIISGIHPPFPNGLTSDCQCFLQSCLDSIPTQRLTAEQLLKHRFIDPVELIRSRKNSNLSYQTPLNKINDTLKTKNSRNDCFPEDINEDIEEIDQSFISRQVAIRQKDRPSKYEEIDNYLEEKTQISEKNKEKSKKRSKNSKRQPNDSFKINDSKRYIEEIEDLEIITQLSKKQDQTSKKLFAKKSKNQNKQLAKTTQTVPNVKLTEKILEDLKQIQESICIEKIQPKIPPLNGITLNEPGLRAKTQMSVKEGEINSIISRQERNRYLQAQKILREQREEEKRKWQKELLQGGAFLRKQISSRYQL